MLTSNTAAPAPKFPEHFIAFCYIKLQKPLQTLSSKALSMLDVTIPHSLWAIIVSISVDRDNWEPLTAWFHLFILSL